MLRSTVFVGSLVLAALCATPLRGSAQEAAPGSSGMEERRPELQRRSAAPEGRVEVDVSREPGPPVWCEGQGRRQEGVENCGHPSARSAAAAAGFRSYAEAHEAFHQYLELKYRTLAAERPLDLRRQLELRARRSAEHERWHAEMGRRHD